MKNIREINQELKRKAENEINEVTSRIKDDLEHIQEWIDKEPHLNFKMEDQLLLSFLRGCKFSLESTKKKIDHYYTMRSLVPELFTNRDPLLPEMQILLNAGVILPLPNPEDNDGCRIIWYNFSNNLDPDTMFFVNGIKLIFMVLDLLLLQDDHIVISGKRSVAYCENCPVKYIVQTTPPLIKRYSHVFESYPLRIKGMYGLNCPQLFEYAHNVMKMCVSKKIGERMDLFSESNINKMYTKIPQRLLPEEFGGSNGSLEKLTIEWKQKVESFREWFLHDEKLKSNETLRRGVPRTSSNVFGIEGSFRKLEVD